MKATARLHAHLLARKGEALPAIQRQRLALAESKLSENEGLDTEDMANMMVGDKDQQRTPFGGADPSRQTPRTFGTSLRHQARGMDAGRNQDSVMFVPEKIVPSRQEHQKVTEKKRIALTLRLDKERHFQLKLLSAHRNLSGQELMIEALDALLNQQRIATPGCPCLQDQGDTGKDQ